MEEEEEEGKKRRVGGGGEEKEEVVEEKVDSLHTVFLELYLQLIAYPCLFMYAFIRSIFFTCT